MLALQYTFKIMILLLTLNGTFLICFEAENSDQHKTFKILIFHPNCSE